MVTSMSAAARARPDRRLEGSRSCRARCRGRRTAPPARLDAAPPARSCSRRRSGRGPGSPPGSTSSSPVARIATTRPAATGRRRGSSRRRARSRGREAAARAASSTSPSREVEAAAADVPPGAGASPTRHADRRRGVAFSWISDAVGALGTGAPVKMRTASPGAERAVEARGRRRDVADDRQARRAGCARRRRARRSRPWRRRRRAAASRRADDRRGEHAAGGLGERHRPRAERRDAAQARRAAPRRPGAGSWLRLRLASAPDLPPASSTQPDVARCACRGRPPWPCRRW